MSGAPEAESKQGQGLLPRLLPLNSVGFHVFLTVLAIFILGPLGGVTAAYMNYALGFFISGQVLAGILGSTVTYFYGPEGKHGANYMQTMAASVAGMGAMGVLIQAMVWLGMPRPPVWQLMAYFLCIGMFGVGVGMLYTPILVDKLKLTYPSGLAVANILRALTDAKLLRRSVGTLGGGIFGGYAVAWGVHRLQTSLEKAGAQVGSALGWVSSFSPVTFGGGMIVGARIALPATMVGFIGLKMTPWLRDEGYLGPNDPFRKIGFIFALGTILGAALVDLSLLAVDAAARFRASKNGSDAQPSTEPSARIGRLVAWVVFWGAALTVVATQVLHVPAGWVLFAIAAAFVFQMINGISQGITDQNPISSAFVVTVLLMGLLGLRDPLIGLLAGSILLVSCTVGVDMQQDRSTGWRLGSDRSIQFRYQMIGVVCGAFIAVFLAQLFLEAFPVLNENLFAHPELRETAAQGWQSAMTYKFVGVLNTLSQDKTKTLSVMLLGLIAGLIIQVIRKWGLSSPRYQSWKVRSTGTKAADFVLDAFVFASPYASSFGGFVDYAAAVWWGLGGAFGSTFNFFAARAQNASTLNHEVADTVLPEDMSTMNLVGGGLIAGESLFALYLGLSSLIERGALGAIFRVG